LPAYEQAPAVAAVSPEDVSAEVSAETDAGVAFDDVDKLGLPEITAPSAVEPVTAMPAVAAPAPVGSGQAGGFEVTGDEIDDEIREVFLEEFEEEINNLDQMLPPWRAVPEDLERLRPIRRVFHTLKGSGRLVGAKTLGEFSWKIEGMLNRVLDGTRPPSPAVLAMVDQAFYALPQLHAALRGEGGISTDLEGMQAFADRIASGEDVFYSAPAADVATPEDIPVAAAEEQAEVQPVDVAVTAEPVDDTLPASVDPVLLEILDAEVGGHLGTVDRWVADARMAPAHVDDALMRAIHTMNGAFAMTDVPSITDVMTPAEAYVKRLLAARVQATAEGVDALAELADAARATVAALQVPSPRVPRFASLAARLVDLRDSLPEARLSFEEQMPEIAEVEFDSTSDPLAQELAALDLSAYGDLTGLPADAVVEQSATALHATDVDVEAERLEAERLEAERLEAERLEAERLEAERLEAERLEAERLEAERLEAESRPADR
jgi:chemosensory pili system protein ChpA (sensor histidine kinase/response regulator)